MLDVERIKFEFYFDGLTSFLTTRFMYLSLRETNENKGFFSSVTAETIWVKRPMEMQLIFDLPIGSIHWIHLDADTVAKGASFFDHPNQPQAIDIGTFKVGALAQFETVNAHQWEGVTPVSSKVHRKGGVTHEKDPEPALWDVATFDQVSGERVLLVRTHANRNDVFAFQNRVQNVVDWAQMIVRDCPPDEKKPDHLDAEILAERIEDTPPPQRF